MYCVSTILLQQHALQYVRPLHVRSNSDWHTESIQSAVLPPSLWSARRRARRSSHTHTVSPTRPHTTLRLRHSQSGAQGPKYKERRPEAAAPNMMHAPGGAPIPLVLCRAKHARQFFQFVRASRLQRSRARPPSGVSHGGSTDGSPVDVHVHDVLELRVAGPGHVRAATIALIRTHDVLVLVLVLPLARPALPYSTSESPSDTGAYAPSAPTASNTFPGASGNVDVGSCSKCGGCRVR